MNNLQTLDGKRLFLTGGTGFLGKNLLRLLEQAHSTLQITLLSRDPERFDRAYPHFRKHLNLTFLKGDIRTFPFPDGNFDFILHGATDADAVMIREQPEEMYSVIVDGTRHLLDFAEKSTSPRLLYLSSGSVYGPQDQGVPFVSETCPPLPETCYGKGKRDAEELCLNSGITCCIARCFTFSGPDLPLDRHYALGNFLADAAAKRPIVVKGDGRTVRIDIRIAGISPAGSSTFCKTRRRERSATRDPISRSPSGSWRRGSGPSPARTFPSLYRKAGTDVLLRATSRISPEPRPSG